MDLSKKVARGIFHTFLGSYTGKACNIVATIYLTRVLSPNDFGTFAMAIFLFSASGLIKEFGLDFALVHRQDDPDDAQTTHFYLSTISAAIGLIVALLLSAFLKEYYDHRTLTAMIFFAAFLLFRSFTATSRIIMEKELRFSELAWIDSSSNILSLITVVILVWLGYGFWSLILAGSANSFVHIALTSLRYMKYQPVNPFKRKRPTWKMVRWYFHYGKWMWIRAIGTVITLQFDDFIAGTLLGVALLGIYERAYRFSMYPTDSVTRVIERVAMSLYANLQHDKEALTKAYSAILSIIVRVSLPFALALFIFADDIVFFIIGEKWKPFIPVLRLLTIYSMLRPLFDDTGVFLAAIGRPKEFTKVISFQAVLVIIMIPLATYHWGLNGTALSMDLTMVAGLIASYWVVSKYISLNYWKIFISPFSCVIISTLVTVWYRHLFHTDSPMTFAMSVVLYLSIYFGIMFVLDKKQLLQIKELLSQ